MPSQSGALIAAQDGGGQGRLYALEPVRARVLKNDRPPPPTPRKFLIQPPGANNGK